MAAWPGTLPTYTMADPWAESAGWGVISSSPDIGPRLTRRRFTATEKPRSAEFILDDAQRAAFETFFESDLAGGALPFDASWDGTNREYLIVQAPTIRQVNTYWRLRLELVVLP